LPLIAVGKLLSHTGRGYASLREEIWGPNSVGRLREPPTQFEKELDTVHPNSIHWTTCGLVWSWLTLACALIAGATPPDEPVAGIEKHQLAFKFTTGLRVTYQITQESRITSQQASTTQIAINQTKVQRTLRVLDVDAEGRAKIEVQLDRVWMSAGFEDEEGTQGDPIVFDSADPAKSGNPKFKHVLDSVGKPQAMMVVDGTGKLHEARRLGAEGSGEATERSRNDNLLFSLPVGPVAVGEIWKETFDVLVRNEESLTVKVKMQTTYALEAVEEGIAKIGYRTVVLSPVEQPVVAAQLIQREMEGKILFDVAAGQIAERNARMDRTVVGGLGPQSTLRAAGQYREVRSAENPVTRESAAVR